MVKNTSIYAAFERMWLHVVNYVDSAIKKTSSSGVKLMTAEEYDAVVDWTTILKEGEIAWRCE